MLFFKKKIIAPVYDLLLSFGCIFSCTVSLLSLFHIMYLFRQSISVIQSCYTYIYIHHWPSSGIPEFRFQCVNVI